MTVYEDEIDLRPYILELIRNWWRIALIAFLAAFVALSYSILQPRQYVATATLLLTRTRSSLFLAEQFPTERETIYESQPRMQALLSIVQSDANAQATLELIGGELPDNERDLEDIKERIEVVSKGDSIQISASAKNPDLAAQLANTWARRAEAAINLAYSGEQPLVEIQNQVGATKQEYESAQSALEAFVQDNQIAVLEKRIAEAQTLLSEVANDRSWQISYYYYRKQAMQSLKNQAEALKEQLETNSRSAAGNIGDSLAIIKTRASAFGIGQYASVRVLENDQLSEKFSVNENPDMTFDLQLSELSGLNDTATMHVSDLEQIIRQADSEMHKADDALDEASQNALEEKPDELIETTGARIRELETQLERQNALQRELLGNRELAWEAYQAMVQKETEIKNNIQINNQITLASPAIPPQTAASRGTVRNTLVAGVLGAFIGIFWVLGSMWWKTIEEPVGPKQSLSAAD